MTKCEKYSDAKWGIAKYASYKQHEYRGDEWASASGWEEEIVLQGDGWSSERVADAIWAAAKQKAERRNPKTTQVFLVQYPICDTGSAATLKKYETEVKRRIEKFDGRTCSEATQAEIERLPKEQSANKPDAGDGR